MSASPSTATELMCAVAALEDLAWKMRRTVPARAGVKPLPGSEMIVLRVILADPGLTVSQAADRLGMHVSNLSTALRSLTAKGLVEKQQDPADRRVTHLIPTTTATQEQQIIEAEYVRLAMALPQRMRRLLVDATPALLALSDAVQR